MNNQKGINVLSLFDGMSCAQLALQKAGIKVNQYFASEIDKYAMQVTQKNFPDTIQLGDVTKVNVAELPKIDILMGGSPCTSLSFAGKRKGMITKCDIEIHDLKTYLELKEQGFEFEGQSYLFWEYMRILTDIRKYNPNVIFLLENVEMGKKWERVLSQAIGVLGIHINSALVSAQNRKRIYWTNIYNQPTGLFGEMQCAIPQPEDKGILLRDILEKEVDEKYFLSDKLLRYFDKRAERYAPPNIRSLDGKSSCIMPNNEGKQGSDMNLIVASRGRFDGEKNTQNLEPRFDGKTNTITSVQKDNLVLTQIGYIGNANSQANRVYDLTKSVCLQGEAGGGGGKTGLHLVKQINPSKESGGKQPYFQNRVYSDEGKCVALTQECARTNVLTQLGYIGNTDSQGNRVYDLTKSTCITSNTGGIGGKTGLYLVDKSPCLHGFDHGQNGQLNKQLVRGGMIRRLTPTECERLQTVPDGYTKGVSDTQRYRMLGNGWTVDVIAYILSFIKL